jgi:hypothetical protein
MENNHPRLIRERKTIEVMSEIYCKDIHGLPNGQLCGECAAVRDYAFQRLSRCPYQEEKPTCANCPIHCYQKDMRVRVRQMMRYAGPKMLLRQPVLAIRHLLDGRRRAQALPGRNAVKTAAEMDE